MPGIQEQMRVLRPDWTTAGSSRVGPTAWDLIQLDASVYDGEWEECCDMSLPPVSRAKDALMAEG
jgi:hypothetical protein